MNLNLQVSQIFLPALKSCIQYLKLKFLLILKLQIMLCKSYFCIINMALMYIMSQCVKLHTVVVSCCATQFTTADYLYVHHFTSQEIEIIL